MQYTENYNLYKPVYGEPADVADLNHNADEIDSLIHDNRTMIAPAYDTAVSYAVGDIVEHLGKVYKCTGATTGVWDSTKWTQTTLADEIEEGAGGASALGDLTDVDLTTPADGEVLTYDSASGKWVNAEIETATSLEELTDTDITTPDDGDILVYDETDEVWKNQPQAVVAKTVSGNPITLTDAADAPMVECKATITPKQDLHGQDKPWPPGAGKNKLPCDYGVSEQSGITFTPNIDGTLKINGTSTATVYYPADYSTQAGIELPAGTYILSGRISGTRVYIHNTDTDTNYGYDTYTGEVTIDIPSGHYVFVVRVATNTTISNETVYPMLRLSTVSDATFKPYSNICPITGMDEVSVNGCGKNLFDITTYPLSAWYYYINRYNGNQDSADGYRCTLDYIPISKLRGRAIYCNYSAGGDRPGYAFYTSANQRQGSFISGGKTYPVIVPDNANYFRFTVNNDVNVNTIQIELGTSATDYEPYTPNNCTIQLGNTYYGGTVDVVRGILTNRMGYIASYNGETIGEPWLSDRDEYVPGTTPTTGAEVVYTLATPVEVPLSPTLIRTLSGYNYIWTDADSMDIEYITKPYEPVIEATDISIEEHGKKIESIITDNLEPLMVASRNYTTGELIISGNKAYRATANIASGATLTVNTNVVATTIEEEIGRSGHVYSTTEQVVGTWIDGSTIYEKVFTNLSVVTNGASWVHISSIDTTTWGEVLDCKIYRKMNNKYTAIPIAEYSGYASQINDLAVSIVSSSFDTTINMAIVQYTKSSS